MRTDFEVAITTYDEHVHIHVIERQQGYVLLSVAVSKRDPEDRQLVATLLLRILERGDPRRG